MGPSGCGKTTLLDTLAGRMKQIKMSGSVHLDGRPATNEGRRQVMSYVASDEALMGVFTASETIVSAICFHYGYSLSVSERRDLAQRCALSQAPTHIPVLCCPH